ncbi:MAG: YceD family protein [Thermoanaerobaculia bacterium]
MDLDLEKALDEPVDLSQRFDVPAERLERSELLSLAPVSFSGRLLRAEPGFVLQGRLDFNGTVACARCLKPVPFRRSGPVSWVFAPAYERHQPVPDADGETELQATDLDVVFYDDFTVPFDPLIDEQVQLEIPMRALCSENCKGLCPECGADRNVAPCTCTPPPDDRWTTLKALQQKDSET